MFKKLNIMAPGLLLSACVAIIAMFLSSLIPGGIDFWERKELLSYRRR